MNTPLWCQSCGASRDRGQLLAVHDLRGVRADAVICRPSVDARCLGYAGKSSRTSISLLDPDAARRWDHEHREHHDKDRNTKRIADAMRSYRKSAEARPIWESA